MKKGVRRRTVRHGFRFNVEIDEGNFSEVVIWARVVDGKKTVRLNLRAEDVEKSIRCKGAGSTQKCSMAVCAKRQRDIFPHPVEGMIDWQYRTAFVVSKIGKDGWPSECVRYVHDDEIARLNDSAAGQQKLLERLKEKGDRVITLRPPRYGRHSTTGRDTGENLGKNRSRPVELPKEAIRSKGSKLRYATAKANGAI